MQTKSKLCYVVTLREENRKKCQEQERERYWISQGFSQDQIVVAELLKHLRYLDLLQPYRPTHTPHSEKLQTTFYSFLFNSVFNSALNFQKSHAVSRQSDFSFNF